MRADSPTVTRKCFAGLAVVVITATLSGWARAQEGTEWTSTDTVVETGCLALLVADWRQTLDRRYTETNAILGPHPDRTKVTLYFVGVTVLQVATTRLLPHPWRTFFQEITIGVEARSVYNNWQLGAKLLW